MSVYANDPLSKPRGVWHASVVMAIGLCVVLLGLSRADHPMLFSLRDTIQVWSAPLVEQVSRVVDPVRKALATIALAVWAADDVQRLTLENSRLKGLTVRLDELERDNRDLSRLLKLATDPALEPIAGRVVSVAPGLVSQAFMIGAGREHGVAVGDPVMASDALVGRVVQVGATGAGVVRLVDPRSRVPVLVGASQARAVLTGDRVEQPRLEFLSPLASVAHDDTVVTSGVGGLIPRGLAVGRVVKVDGIWRVALAVAPETLRVVAVLRTRPRDMEPLNGAIGQGSSLSTARERRVAADGIGTAATGSLP
jgi:rod shape-determining protein MreC